MFYLADNRMTLSVTRIMKDKVFTFGLFQALSSSYVPAEKANTVKLEKSKIFLLIRFYQLSLVNLSCVHTKR